MENPVKTKTIKKLSPSPFIKDAAKPEVWVANGQDAYANTMTALANIDLSLARGKRVLLKPNAGRIAHAGSGIARRMDRTHATVSSHSPSRGKAELDD